jgi:hypothetical protein
MRHVRFAKLAVIGAALTGALIWLPSAAQETSPKQLAAKPKDSPRPQLEEFMQKKLDASSQILEGLLVEDFEQIEKAGKQLREMSNTEKWRVSTDLMYRNHSQDFQRSVDKLIQAAGKGQSMDRIALAWFDTTLSCIECHRWVRNVLIADSDAPLTRPIGQSVGNH